jgi:hypothetical protein
MVAATAAIAMVRRIGSMTEIMTEAVSMTVMAVTTGV